MPTSSTRTTLTRVKGVRVGQSESRNGTTGVSAILFDHPAPTTVDVRGGASGTYDTASLALDATFGLRHAIFFSGGSLFGLDAARGVRTRILETGGGVRVFGTPRRIAPVSGAILFDLPPGGGRVPDYERLGYLAAARASRAPVREGRVGAGAGATVGKYLGRRSASPGGIGSASARVPELGWVGVVAAVNAVGAIRDPSTGAWVEGARADGGDVIPPASSWRGGFHPARSRGTTLVAVVTDIYVGRPTLQRLCVYAHDGLARVVDPAHSATDGDAVFASSTGRGPETRPGKFPGEISDRLGGLAASLVADAVVAAVRKAASPTPPAPGGGSRGARV